MKVFKVALKHTTFRNIVAHSPIKITEAADGMYTIHGILGLTPSSKDKVGELISLEEMKDWVRVSAAITKIVLEMQADFPEGTHGSLPRCELARSTSN